MFPYFEIFGRVIGSYALCAVVGIMICVWMATRLGRNYNIKFEDILMLMVSIGIGMIVGGHFLYGITNTPQLVELCLKIRKLPLEEIAATLVVCFGGMVFYGGFIGAAIAVKIYSRFTKLESKGQLQDLFGISIPLFHTFGRIGCFFGGCCYGKESTWGFVVHDNMLQPEINDVVRIPVQLIESACNLCIFILLYILFKKNVQQGKLVFIYMLIYPIVRFVTEFFRGDEIRGFLWGLSTSQWISIILFFIALYELFLKKKFFQKKN